MTPVAKKVLQEASQPNRRKLYVTAQQVLAQILALQPPDPAAVLLGALGVNTSEVRRRLDAVTPKAESPATFTTSSEAASLGRSRQCAVASTWSLVPTTGVARTSTHGISDRE